MRAIEALQQEPRRRLHTSGARMPGKQTPPVFFPYVVEPETARAVLNEQIQRGQILPVRLHVLNVAHVNATLLPRRIPLGRRWFDRSEGPQHATRPVVAPPPIGTL